MDEQIFKVQVGLLNHIAFPTILVYNEHKTIIKEMPASQELMEDFFPKGVCCRFVLGYIEDDLLRMSKLLEDQGW